MSSIRSNGRQNQNNPQLKNAGEHRALTSYRRDLKVDAGEHEAFTGAGFFDAEELEANYIACGGELGDASERLERTRRLAEPVVVLEPGDIFAPGFDPELAEEPTAIAPTPRSPKAVR